MGVVAFPPNPTGPGSCWVHLELDKAETRITIDRLKQAIERLAAARAAQGIAGLQIAPAPAGPVATDSVAGSAEIADARAETPVCPPAPATAGARVPSGAAPRLSWEVCLVTDTMDHNRDPVQALQYCTAIDGLPSGDGHGGWLVSSSRKLLNLWECSAGGGRGAPSLMLLHSQETDFSSSHLAAEPSCQLLFAASADARTGAECVTIHSLNPEAGMLAFKYKLAVVPPNQQRPAPPPGGPQPPRLLSKVASLHSFGGGLRSTCAAAYQGNVYVYDAPGLAAPPGAPPTGAPPKGSWKAHDSAPISALVTSNAGGARVATGAKDGHVILWDMRQRPPGNSWRARAHTQAVTGLQVTNDTTIVTTALDGKVNIWDLRSTAAPRASCSPDGSAVLGVKTSPAGDCVAVFTQKNLVSVDLLDGGASTSPITTSPLPRPYLDITWNAATAEIYAASTTGTVTVYRQTYS
ncbi:hypothetical protein GPECTOR_23g57 [Gonium pectorale]|uniref:Uncharacterized protein n=1 Tax=Gonium pectorale TaxID=33097 RepID=A0A150GH10_GONPE|nr:hypothetical protein GPECTOR_23g57 [Gonium pectorale]|eukprot:KXZ49128.1 hypothetical protein GPECTOR_23g57 [Gonium pectorale]